MNSGQDIRYGQTSLYGQYSSWPGYLGRTVLSSDLIIKVWAGPLLGDYDLAELGMFLVDETILGVSPSIKIEEITIPGRHGAFLQGTKLGDRVFELVLNVDPNRDLDLEYPDRVDRFLRVRDRIAGILNSIRDNSTLTFAEEPERAYRVLWRDLASIQEYIDSGILTIPLVAQPEVISTEEHMISIPANTSVDITYSGTKETFPTITLKSLDSVTILVDDRVTRLRPVTRTDLTGYSGTIINGASLEILSQYDQGSVTDLDRLQDHFPLLKHGRNSIMATTDITLIYHDVWTE